MNIRLSSCLPLLMPLLAHAATAPPQIAAQSDSADFVIAMLASANRITSVVTGRATDGFPAALVPEGYVILGGAESENTTMNVAMTTADEPEARSAAEARFLAAGWSKPPPVLPQALGGGGFVNATSIAPVSSFCGADDMQMTLLVVPRAAGGSYVKWTRIKHEPTNVGAYTGSRCSPQMAPGVAAGLQAAARAGVLDVPMPTLTVPAGVRQTGGGGSSGGSGRTATARLATSLPLNDILSHYAEQLEGKGWRTIARAVVEGAALQRFRYSDDRGRNWRGMLTIGATDDGYDVSFSSGPAANAP